VVDNGKTKGKWKEDGIVGGTSFDGKERKKEKEGSIKKREKGVGG
jgi:hypothetical protein